MNKITLIVCLLTSSILAVASESPDIEIQKKTCTQERPGDPVVSNTDFSWHMTREEIIAKQNEIYFSKKRLKERAYYDKENQVIRASIQTVRGARNIITVPKRFLISIKKHVEKALQRNYVDAIIFPDMGHSHYFIPQEFYDRVIAPLPVSEKAKAYELMFSYDGLKVLYHTAEQLKMIDPDDEEKKLIDDRMIQWRFYTRNIVGDNKMRGELEIIHDKNHSHNSARDYDEGYKYWGGGFYISANQDGCFAYQHKGETYYFDINFKGIHNSGGYF